MPRIPLAAETERDAIALPDGGDEAVTMLRKSTDEERYGCLFGLLGAVLGVSVILSLVSSRIETTISHDSSTSPAYWLSVLGDIVVGAVLGCLVGTLCWNVIARVWRPARPATVPEAIAASDQPGVPRTSGFVTNGEGLGCFGFVAGAVIGVLHETRVVDRGVREMLEENPGMHVSGCGMPYMAAMFIGVVFGGLGGALVGMVVARIPFVARILEFPLTGRGPHARTSRDPDLDRRGESPSGS